MAALLGLEAQIYVPTGTAQARIDGIASEGARVEIVEGTYDDAVARAAQDASERCLVISDTSWPGYEEIPRWVMEGYSTIMAEIDDELARLGGKNPDLIAVQFGVGALAAAVVRHYRQAGRDARPKILSVEPLSAACMLASMEAGEIVTVPGPHDSIMAGLNCGRPSIIAWPIVSTGIDAFIAIPDERAREAMRALARVGIVAGETGAAGLAGLIELLTGAENGSIPRGTGDRRGAAVLVLVTEGATDPEACPGASSSEGLMHTAGRDKRPSPSAPTAQPLQRQPNEIFGALRFLAALLNFPHRLVRIDLFVAERDQGQHRFVRLFLLRRRRMRAARRFPRRRHAQLVFQLEHDSLRRFFPEAADFRERRDVGVHDRAFEIAHAHSAQDGEREFRADPADVIDEQTKQIALGRGHEAVKNVRVFAHVQMGQNLHRLARRREFVVARERDENFVADAAHIDDGLGRQRAR